MELFGGAVMKEVGHWMDLMHLELLSHSEFTLSDSCLRLRCKEMVKRPALVPAAMTLLLFLPIVTFGCGILS